MKKLFLLLALCGFMVACGDDKKSEEDDSNKYVEVMEDLYDAIMDEDYEKIQKLGEKADKMDEPSDSDKKEIEKWIEKNPEKVEVLEDFFGSGSFDEYEDEYYSEDDYDYEDEYYYEDDEYYYEDDDYYYDDEEYYYDDEEYYW